MRVLVTGASGFLGRSVVDALLARRHEVRALVRPGTKVDGLWSGPVDVVRADLASRSDRLDGVFDDVDSLVHLAAGMTGDEHERFAVTVVGSERLLEAMSRSACRRVVLTSSVTVYDWVGARGPVAEDDPLAPDLEARGGYTRAKVWQERVVRRMSDEHGLRLTVVRPGILWGRGNSLPAGVTVPVGRSHVVFGVRTRLPLTYVENCADGLAAVMESDAAVGQTFNLVDPDPMATGRFVREHLGRSGAAASVVAVPYPLGLMAVQLVDAANRLVFRGGGRLPSLFVPARFIARFRPLAFSTSRLEEVVHWRPPYDCTDALERTYGDVRDD